MLNIIEINCDTDTVTLLDTTTKETWETTIQKICLMAAMRWYSRKAYSDKQINAVAIRRNHYEFWLKTPKCCYIEGDRAEQKEMIYLFRLPLGEQNFHEIGYTIYSTVTECDEADIELIKKVNNYYTDCLADSTQSQPDSVPYNIPVLMATQSTESENKIEYNFSKTGISTKKKYRIYFADNQCAEGVAVKTVTTDDIETQLKITMLFLFYEYAIDVGDVESIDVDIEKLKIVFVLNDFHVAVWAEEDTPFMKEPRRSDKLVEAAKQLDVKTIHGYNNIDEFVRKCLDILYKCNETTDE